MSGHVRKRGDKWYYSFEASNVDGKRKRIERVGGRTKKEAEAALRIALQEYDNAGLHFEPSEISYADYLDYWIKEYVTLNCKYNTVESYKQIIINHLKPAIGVYRLKSLTPAIIQQFVNEKYLNGFSRHHLVNMLSVISGSLKYAVHPCKFVKDNPAQYVKLPRMEKPKFEDTHKILSSEEFDAIIQRFPLGSNLYTPPVLAYHTGMRAAEVTGLTWDRVDFENRLITVDRILINQKGNFYFGTPKTQGSDREIYMGDTLVQALKEIKAWQEANAERYGKFYAQYYLSKDGLIYKSPVETTDPKLNLVCVAENGDHITTNSIKYLSRVVNYELGINFNFHSLRHTHATILVEHGADYKEIQKRLGHSRLSTTMDTYVHPTFKMKKDAVDVFEKALKSGLPTE